MARSPERAVWDACVIIDAIQRTPGRYELIEPFLLGAQRGGFEIVVPESVVAEVDCLKALDDHGVSRDEQAALIQAWLENSYIVRRGLHQGISELASEVGRKHGIKGGTDRIVIATALFDHIPVVHTFDGEGDRQGLLDFDKKIGNPPLRIMKPTFSWGELFDQASH